MDHSNYQGGKQFGRLKRAQEEKLDEINKQFLDDDDYQEVEELSEKLQKYREQFMEFDEDDSGDIDIMELKRMMEKLGQAKTHLELKKMIAEVDTTDSGTIHYDEFLNMMLGKKNSILKMFLTAHSVLEEGSLWQNFRRISLEPVQDFPEPQLKLILMFEEKNKEKERPTGPPPKKSLTDLP